MNSIVVYTTHFGNTKKVAEAIAAGLGTRGNAQVLSVDELGAMLPPDTDLVVIGGPTEAHRMTHPMAELFKRLGPNAVRGVAAVAFDTRLRWPRWLSGSAGASIAKELEQAGARVIAPVESFFIKGAAGTGGSSSAELEDGELERAQTWAAALAETMAVGAATPGSSPDGSHG